MPQPLSCTTSHRSITENIPVLASPTRRRMVAHRRSPQTIPIHPNDAAEVIAHKTLHRLSSTAIECFTTEEILMRVNIRFLGIACEDTHYVFVIHVDTGRTHAILTKRYSEFRAFRQELKHAMFENESQCHMGPCRQLHHVDKMHFPKRRLQFKPMDVAQVRIAPLERYMKAILRVYRMASRRCMRSCVNQQCRVLAMIVAFLEIPDAEETATEPTYPMARPMHEAYNDFNSTTTPRTPPTTRVSLDFDRQLLYPITEEPM